MLTFKKYTLVHGMSIFNKQKKLDARDYETAQEFIEDVRQMFTNCYKYNPPEHEVVKMGRRLQEVFEQKMSRLPDEPTSKLNFNL